MGKKKPEPKDEPARVSDDEALAAVSKVSAVLIPLCKLDRERVLGSVKDLLGIYIDR